MSYLTIANYFVVAALWLVILVLYIRHRRVARIEDPLVATLLSILALDALKSLVENVFFGIIWAHNYNIAFHRLGETLSEPQFLIAPKLLNTFVAITVVTVVIQRWIPAELRARREREHERAGLLQALSESLAETKFKEQRWQLALDATRDGIFDLDVVEDRLWVSPRFGETLGYSAGEVLGGTRQTLVDFSHVEDRAAVASFLEAVIADASAPRELEVRQRTREQRHRVVTLRVAPVREPNGRATRLVGAQSDVTDRRANEAALAVRQRIESLGLLAGGVAHDFNNLLAVMKANVESLSSGRNDPDALEDLDQAVVRATELTSQLLAYSGRGRLSVKSIDISTLAADLVRLLHTATPENVKLIVRPSAEPPVVVGDSAQLQQVVMNLLTNAIDAMGTREGTITVTTSLEEVTSDEDLAFGAGELQPGTYVALSVEDTGCGMSDEVRERIFDPFFTTKPAGRGLGMAAILGTLRAHKGGLRIRSVEGKGTRFVVLLPVASRATPAGEPAAGGARARRVLIVDDDAMVLRSVARTMQHLGCEVGSVQSGKTALETLAKASFDLVLLDLTMPEMDGREVLEQLRARWPELPVILMSGYAAGGTPTSPRTCFLRKPFTLQAVRACMHTLGLEDHPSPGR